MILAWRKLLSAAGAAIACDSRDRQGSRRDCFGFARGYAGLRKRAVDKQKDYKSGGKEDGTIKR